MASRPTPAKAATVRVRRCAVASSSCSSGIDHHELPTTLGHGTSAASACRPCVLASGTALLAATGRDRHAGRHEARGCSWSTTRRLSAVARELLEDGGFDVVGEAGRRRRGARCRTGAAPRRGAARRTPPRRQRASTWRRTMTEPRRASGRRTHLDRGLRVRRRRLRGPRVPAQGRAERRGPACRPGGTIHEPARLVGAGHLVGGAALAFGVFAEYGRRAVGRPLDLAVLDFVAGARLRRGRRSGLPVAPAGQPVLVDADGRRAPAGSSARWRASSTRTWPSSASPPGRGTTSSWPGCCSRSPPAGSPPRRGRALLAVIGRGAGHCGPWSRLFLYVPPDGTGCDCVHNRFIPVSDPTVVRRHGGRLSRGCRPSCSRLVVAETLLRWRRSSGAGRRMLTPVLAMGDRGRGADRLRPGASVRSWPGPCCGPSDLFLLVVVVRSVAAVSFVVGIRRTGSTRNAVVGVMGEPGRAAPIRRRLAAALRSALEDPSLVLLPWSGAAPGTSTRPVDVSSPRPGRAGR